MEIKHQVFVSSTFRDLIEERKAVIHALLELDCIPAGMELFPAADEDAWSLIKEVIDGCDYYILIIAGKYGSTNSEGISYTELEFDYAVESGKPVIAFLHEDIESLIATNVEKSAKGRKSLKAFREKAQQKHCKYWSTSDDLGGKVSRSLVNLRKRHPAEGWVRGSYAADDKMMRELEELRRKLIEVELASERAIVTPPPDFETLEHGKDRITIEVEIKYDAKSKKKVFTTTPSWDALFSYCGPSLVGECDDAELDDKISLCVLHHTPRDTIRLNSHDGGIIIPYVMEDAIKMQFQALGFMEGGSKRRAVSDTKTYWALTPFGQKYLIDIRARRRKPKED